MNRGGPFAAGDFQVRQTPRATANGECPEEKRSPSDRSTRYCPYHTTSIRKRTPKARLPRSASDQMLRTWVTRYCPSGRHRIPFSLSAGYPPLLSLPSKGPRRNTYCIQSLFPLRTFAGRRSGGERRSPRDLGQSPCQSRNPHKPHLRAVWSGGEAMKYRIPSP